MNKPSNSKTMRTAGILLCFLYFLLTGSYVDAQENRYELALGGGVVSANKLETSEFWGKNLDGKGSTHVTSSGVYHLGIQVMKKERASLSFLVTGESHKVTKNGQPGPDFRDKYIERKDTHLALLVDLRYHWFVRPATRWPATRWYSGIAPGVAWSNIKEVHNDFTPVLENSSKTRLAYHVTAVGVTVGKKTAGYVELGYGYKGLLSGGIRRSF